MHWAYASEGIQSEHHLEHATDLRSCSNRAPKTMTSPTPICEDCIPSTSDLSTAPATAVSPEPAAYDPILDPTTFVPPSYNRGSSNEELPRVVIEFCDRCRWLSRATWTLTEVHLPLPFHPPPTLTHSTPQLFLTFPPTPTTGLRSISLLPRSAPETGGRFRVWLYKSLPPTPIPGTEHWEGAELVWDRKIEGGFPEMKELKQRIRTLIEPSKSLGHSDKAGKDKIAVGLLGEKVKELEIEKKEEEKEEGERETTVDDYAPRFRC
jgi:predicted Rdx family selenoprotein